MKCSNCGKEVKQNIYLCPHFDCAIANNDLQNKDLHICLCMLNPNSHVLCVI